MAAYNVNEISEIASEFQKANHELTQFEALQVALQYCKNEIDYERTEVLECAFNVPQDPFDRYKTPAALEAIAIQLGFNKYKVIKDRKDDEFQKF